MQVTLEALPRIIDIMGEELGWDNKRKNSEFDSAVYFLRSMGLPEVRIPGNLEYVLGKKADRQGTNLNLADMRRNQGTKTFLGLHPEDAKLYERAQFTPDEVNNLREQFESLDFVSGDTVSYTFTARSKLWFDFG